MKARLVPVYFELGDTDEFNSQLKVLKNLLSEEADLLEPTVIGKELPDADAVIFPQLIGEAYKQAAEIEKITLPILVVTSEFGTVSMWDWEIATFLKDRGLTIFTPYNLEQTKLICRTLALKKEMKSAQFLVFQDTPGDGMQSSIFKRFYWWEDTCTQAIEDKFGIKIIKKSYKKLAEDAKLISDGEAEEVLKNKNLPGNMTTQEALLSAIKLYIAIKRQVECCDNIRGVGINCLNESFYSDSTPCLAWSLLYEEKGLLWACEADTISLVTKYIIDKTLKAPVMMSNIYPFLMGMAALKHERIDKFPNVSEPENCMLVAHCGYVGCIPQVFSSEWTLRPKVLEIVNENASAIDAKFSVGKVTLAKLHPSFKKLQVIDGEIEGYAQYPNSDCRNGAVVRVKNGHKMMDELYSHHICFVRGQVSTELNMVARILLLDIECS